MQARLGGKLNKISVAVEGITGDPSLLLVVDLKSAPKSNETAAGNHRSLSQIAIQYPSLAGESARFRQQ